MSVWSCKVMLKQSCTFRGIKNMVHYSTLSYWYRYCYFVILVITIIVITIIVIINIIILISLSSSLSSLPSLSCCPNREAHKNYACSACCQYKSSALALSATSYTVCKDSNHQPSDSVTVAFHYLKCTLTQKYLFSLY